MNEAYTCRNGEAFTFITLDQPIGYDFLEAFEKELEVQCTEEELELVEEHLIQLWHDGWGSVRFEWYTDYNGNINAELAELLERWHGEGFFWSFDCVYDLVHEEAA